MTYATEGFEAHYGLVLSQVTPELVLGEVTIDDRLRDRTGAVHGGVFAAIAESLATAGTRRGVSAGCRAMPLSNLTSHVQEVAAGTLHARAVRRHAGRTTWVWEIAIRDDAGGACAFARTTIAVGDA